MIIGATRRTSVDSVGPRPAPHTVATQYLGSIDIESRMFVKGGLGFGVVGALRWPRVARLVWVRSGIGGHDREESPTGGGGTLVASHTVAGPAMSGVSGSAGHSLHNPMGV